MPISSDKRRAKTSEPPYPKVSIIFIHGGKITPPNCMVDSIAIAGLIAPLSEIIILIDEKHIKFLQIQIQNRYKVAINNLRWISIESLATQSFSAKFKQSAKADRDFRDGFWLETANRFMLIADLMLALELENCLHLENDNVLYFDPTSKIEAFRAHSRFAVPFDRTRAIPGIVWYRDAGIAKDLASFIQSNSGDADFDVIRLFCDSGKFDTKSLPTMSPKYATVNSLPIEIYADGYDSFGGIFDAAAIGQYIGGVDPRNIPGSTRFFINETSDLDLSKCGLIWDYCESRRSPALDMEGEYVKVLSVHAHSKDSWGPSPFNRFVLENTAQVITGERIQELADISIASDEVIKFHGIDNIRTSYILEIPKEKQRKNIFKSKMVNGPPDESWVQKCNNVDTIFVYTHLLGYFEQYILRRLNSPFTLITHNSDDAVTIRHLDILNYPFLQKWYAQNCEFNHKKLIPLPIGLANRQWGKDKVLQLFDKSKKFRKSKLIYSNFSTHTHSGREILVKEIQGLGSITRTSNIEYAEYLEELSQHQFCLCPRGNGIDTHRFWESQYLNTIPIVISADWTAAYSDLPVLVLHSWSQLGEIDFHKEYIRISSSFYNRDSLKLKYYEHLIGVKSEIDAYCD